MFIFGQLQIQSPDSKYSYTRKGMVSKTRQKTRKVRLSLSLSPVREMDQISTTADPNYTHQL